MNSNINKEILRLAWPAIATNITTPLLSLADVAIVGHLSGDCVGAVAVGGTVFNILYWMFAFLRMGTSGMTAQAYGADDSAGWLRILRRGMIIAVIGALFILCLAPLVGEDVISFVDGSGRVQSLAWEYFSLAILGAPGVLVTYVVSGWLLGMQRSRPILWIALVTNILNIALSVTFVFAMELGIAGVALGTAISQITGAVIGLVVVYKLRKTEKSKCEYIDSPEKSQDLSWRRFFNVNRDIFLRTMCLAAVTLWFTHAGSTISATVLAANSLLMQFFLVFSYFMDGFAFGGEALAGRYYGAKDYATLRLAVRQLFVWGIATSVVFTVLYFVASDIFIVWLTDDRHIISEALRYRLWTVVVPFAGFAAFTWDGIMIGLTHTRALLISMAVAMIVFFGTYLTATHFTDLNPAHLLWFAFVLYLAVRGVVATLLYRRFLHHLRD